MGLHCSTRAGSRPERAASPVRPASSSAAWRGRHCSCWGPFAIRARLPRGLVVLAFPGVQARTPCGCRPLGAKQRRWVVAGKRRRTGEPGALTIHSKYSYRLTAMGKCPLKKVWSITIPNYMTFTHRGPPSKKHSCATLLASWQA